jgi:hypothetical protein
VVIYELDENLVLIIDLIFSVYILHRLLLDEFEWRLVFDDHLEQWVKSQQNEPRL